MTSSASGPPIRRGDVFWVDFDPVVGSEIAKLRPAVVVSNDLGNRFAPIVTVVPFSTFQGGRTFPFEVRVPAPEGGLTATSLAKCNQVRTVDKQRVHGQLGVLSPRYAALIDQALRRHLSLD